VINCYTYHGRQDLLPKFSEEEEIVAKAPSKKVIYFLNTCHKNHRVSGE
jgi:hypothetical protein